MVFIPRKVTSRTIDCERVICPKTQSRDRKPTMKTHEKIDIYLCICSVQQSSGLTKLFP